MTTAESQPEIAPAIRARPWWLHDGLSALFLIAVTVLAYWPAMHGDYVWDDNDHISTNATLRSLHGLWEIWFQPGATCQYYPLTFTGFWIGYQLWGLNPLGYHLLNVLLHGVVAVLLWQVLARLKVRGAWLAGSLFALHPVCVMSVAWMTELKNTLSAALALGAGWAYLRFARLGVYNEENKANIQHPTSNTQHPMLQPASKGRSWTHWMLGVGCWMLDVSNSHSIKPPGPGGSRARWRFYVLSLVLFQLALFAKTAVSFLPVSLLLVIWWQRERLRWRDVWPLIPMLGVVGAMGWLTFHIEHLHGASGQQFHLGFLERVLISGRSFWFYLGKLFYPHQLTFIYERWQVDAGAAWQYLYPLAAAGLLIGVWWNRRRLGKGLLAALLHFFVCTSLLILLVVLYMTRYSFVSDHWQYFGCMSIMAVVAAGLTSLFQGGACSGATASWSAPALWRFSRLESGGGPPRSKTCRIASHPFFQAAFCGAMLTTLGILTWRQCGMYTNLETLWRTTLDRNPRAFLAHNNLGELLAQRGMMDEAAAHFQKALESQPDFAEAHYNFGNALVQKRRLDEAIVQFQKTLELQPDFAEAHNNLGNVLLEKGRLDEAIPHFAKALEFQPDFAEAHFSFGNALMQKGRLDEAIPHFRTALKSQPGLAPAHGNLALALQRKGRTREAIAEYQSFLKLQPNDVPALSDLAWLLATSPEASVRNRVQAIQLAQRANQLSGGRDPVVLRALAAAYAEGGQFTEAVAAAQRALQLAGSNAALAEALRSQLKLYQAGSPFRDPGPAASANPNQP